MLYWRIKNEYEQECIHANEKYQEFVDTIEVHYWEFIYSVTHRTKEYMSRFDWEDEHEITIRKVNRTDWMLKREQRELFYYYKYNNRSVDWINLVTNAIEDDYPHSETEDDSF